MEMDQLNTFELLRALCADLDVDKKTSKYVLNRLSCEGLPFVTQTLPAFSKHVLSCLEKGFWTAFGSSIRCVRGLPVIFRGYLLELFTFNPASKRYEVSTTACPVAIYVIRQVCEYLYKLALPFSDEQLAASNDKFKETDSSVLSSGDYEHHFVDAMRRNFQTYYPTAFNLTLDDVAAKAHPGPGTYSNCTKNFWMRNYQRPRIRRRYRDYAFGLRFNTRSPRAALGSRDVDYSEVLFVPKDSRGPRVIMREPYDSLLFQMGYFSQMSAALERDTHYRINFLDQSINRDLAHKASIDRRLSTLDLRDASDRVSYAIVRHLFRYSPLSRAFDKFRTPWAKCPDGTLRRIKKLAGMGSGLTFPTMALVIHLAIATACSRRFGIQYRDASKNIYVYGDDIVIPTEWYECAVAALQRVGLCVNESKSYRHSYFRESCGGDYFRGNDVTPVRLKLSSGSPKALGYMVYPGRKRSVDLFYLGLERHARELVKNQLHSASAYLYRVLENRLGSLPYVSGDSHVLGRYTSSDTVRHQMTQDAVGNYSRVKAYVPVPVNRGVIRPCPYQYLKTRVKVDKGSKWKDELFPAGIASMFGEASIPRRVNLRKRSVSQLALI